MVVKLSVVIELSTNFGLSLVVKLSVVVELSTDFGLSLVVKLSVVIELSLFVELLVIVRLSLFNEVIALSVSEEAELFVFVESEPSDTLKVEELSDSEVLVVAIVLTKVVDSAIVFDGSVDDSVKVESCVVIITVVTSLSTLSVNDSPTFNDLIDLILSSTRSTNSLTGEISVVIVDSFTFSVEFSETVDNAVKFSE